MPDTIIWYGDECWFCGADVDRSTQMAQTRVWLATLAAVAAGHRRNACRLRRERLPGVRRAPRRPELADGRARVGGYLRQVTAA